MRANAFLKIMQLETVDVSGIHLLAMLSKSHEPLTLWQFRGFRNRLPDSRKAEAAPGLRQQAS